MLFARGFGDLDGDFLPVDEGIFNSSENSNGFDCLVCVFKLVFGDPDRRCWPDGGTLKSNSSLSRRLLLGLSSSVSRAPANGEEKTSISSENVNAGGGGRGALVFVFVVVVFAENGGGLETNGGGGARDCAGGGFPAGAGGVEEMRSIMSGILFFCVRGGGLNKVWIYS